MGRKSRHSRRSANGRRAENTRTSTLAVGSDRFDRRESPVRPCGQTLVAHDPREPLVLVLRA